MEPLTTNRLIHGTGKGHTEVLISGAEPLLVTEHLRAVKAQVENDGWAVLTLDDDAASEVEIRSASVVALIDLGNHSE